MSRRWHQLATMRCIARGRWQPSRLPGRARSKPLKPFAQGMPECFGEPVVTNLRVFYFYTQGCGWALAPGIPCALYFSRDNLLAELGRIALREYRCVAV